MKGVDMNFKPNILKLSIIIMLVLVLIPAIAAENSTETFFEEYEVAEEEVCVEEYVFSDEYYEEAAQVETSKSHEIEAVNEDDYIDDASCFVNESVKMNDDDVNVIVAEEKSALDPQNIIDDAENQTTELLCGDFTEINDNIIESSDDEITLETQSIDVNTVNISISNFNVMTFNLSFLNNVIFCSPFSFKTTGFSRNILKNLDIKDDLLNDDWVCVYYNVNGIVVIQLNDGEIIEKHIGDFAYSIDNSIIGDEGRHFCELATFSTFNNIYDNTSFVNEFLYKTVEFSSDIYFIGGEPL